MKYLKIALVVPPSCDSPFGQPWLPEPLGLEYIAASVNQIGFDCEIKIIEETDIDKAFYYLQDYNIVGLGPITPQVPWSLKLGKLLRARDIMTVLGGYHASACPEIVLDPGVDFVIKGEGEEAFPALLLMLQAGCCNPDSWKEIPGLVWQKQNDKYALKATRPVDINKLRWPIRSKDLITSCRLEGLAYPPISRQKGVAQISFSRGCSRNCRYCSNKEVFGSCVRYRNPDDVVNELSQLVNEYEANLIYLCDPNPLLQPKRMIELCRQMIKYQRISWYCSPDPTDLCYAGEEMVQLMANAGCFKVAIGIETTYEPTYRYLRPWSSLEDISRATQLADEAGMLVRGYYMIGIPDQGETEFVEGVERLCTLPVHELRLSFYTPFPGRADHKRFKDKGAFLSLNLEEFTTAQPILYLPEFPPERQIERYRWTVERFYEGKEYKERMKSKIARQPHLETSFADLERQVSNYLSS